MTQRKLAIMTTIQASALTLADRHLLNHRQMYSSASDDGACISDYTSGFVLCQGFCQYKHSLPHTGASGEDIMTSK